MSQTEGLPAVDEYTHLNEQSNPDAPCSIYFHVELNRQTQDYLGQLKGIDHFIR